MSCMTIFCECFEPSSITGLLQRGQFDTISTRHFPQKRKLCLSSRSFLANNPDHPPWPSSYTSHLWQVAVRYNDFIPSQCASVWGLPKKMVKIVCKKTLHQRQFQGDNMDHLQKKVVVWECPKNVYLGWLSKTLMIDVHNLVKWKKKIKNL